MLSFSIAFWPIVRRSYAHSRDIREACGVNGDANYTINVANANTYAK